MAFFSEKHSECKYTKLRPRNIYWGVLEGQKHLFFKFHTHSRCFMSNLKLFQTALRAEMLQVHSQHGKGNRCQISSKYLEKCGGYSHLNLKIGWKNEYFFLPLHIFGDSVKTVTDRDLGLILLDSSPPCASFWLFVAFHILYLADYSSFLSHE